MTLATVLPLLYVAIVLEGRFGWLPRSADTPQARYDLESTKMRGISLATDQAMARLLVFVGLPLTEVGLLVGIEAVSASASWTARWRWSGSAPCWC
jgi:hypothetical protein